MGSHRVPARLARHARHSFAPLRWGSNLLACSMAGLLALSLAAARAAPALAAAPAVAAAALMPLRLPDDPPPPLPADCAGLVPPGEVPPAACVYGYVLWDGLPVAGATVLIRTETALVSVSTQGGPASPQPYFAAALSGSPLHTLPGELVKVEATYGGRTNMTTFTVVEQGQQVDVQLSSTCGPTVVPGGMLVADTTWSPACGPYVVTGNLLAPNGVTLTVEAGTTVRFATGTALQVDGLLVVQGVANAMVTFTSNASGAPGDWGYILLRETVAPQPFDDLDYVLIEYAGGASITNNAALRVDGAWPGLHDITVRHSASDGVRFWNGAIGGISRSTIYDNAGWGINVNSTALSAANSALHVHHNGDGGIYVSGSGPVWLSGSVIRQNSGRGLEARGSALDVYVLQTLVSGNSANAGGGIYVYQATLDLSGSWVLGNTATGSSDGGGIFCGTSSICLIERNIIGDNSAGDQGGGIQVAGGLTGSPHAVEHNIFFGNAAASGGGLAVIGGPVPWTVANNAFLDNTATGNGAALYVTRDIAVTHNTVLHNTAGLGLGGIYAKNHPVFNWNNLYENADYDLYNDTPQGGSDLNAEVNWWGTIDPALIMAHIWDWFDNPALGLVDYDPWLAGHFLTAPISPPTGLVATSNGETFTLAWSPNAESDLAGYKVYYDADGPGFPYGGTGASEGDSPVDVGNVLGATLSGLPPGTYYLSVTAYDTSADGVDDQTDGNESWFAHEVAISPQSCCDFDGDGAIDVDDLVIIAGLWSQPAAAPYDLDGDGWITVVDIQRTARWWGWSVP